MEADKMWIYHRMKANVKPAVGCTEPVAVGFLAAQTRKYLGGVPEKARVIVSKNIFKNGKSVYIPGTGATGLELAAAIGFVRENPGQGLMVFSGMEKEEIAAARCLMESGAVELEVNTGRSDVYVEIFAEAGEDSVHLMLEGSHDHVTLVEKNSQLIFREEAARSSGSQEYAHVDLADIIELTESLSDEQTAFVQEGIDINFRAAQTALSGNYGLNLGRTLQAVSEESGSLSEIEEARMLTAAAADLRMGGELMPIVTSGGSGNQGIGIIIPITVVAKHRNIDPARRNRALVLGHMVNELVKMYSGKLSGMCGCAIGSGVGSAAGITWMLGGSEEQIAQACSIIFANLTGMLCDGAKDTCAIKLSTCAGEAVTSAYLALKGMKLQPRVGVVGRNLDETVRNVGYLAKEGFPLVDEKLLDLITEKD